MHRSGGGKTRVPIENIKFQQKKCQVDPSCNQAATSICSEQAYRGCTLAYCRFHSGKENCKRKKCCLCKLCSRDKHEDICSECSNDILSAQRKFYCMSLVLGLLVFCVLVCLLHVTLQAIPGICPRMGPAQQQSTVCRAFHDFWHEISIYDREPDGPHLERAAANDSPAAIEDANSDEATIPLLDPYPLHTV